MWLYIYIHTHTHTCTCICLRVIIVDIFSHLCGICGPMVAQMTAPRNPSLCLCATARSLALSWRLPDLPGLGSCSWVSQEFSGGSIHMSVDQVDQWKWEYDGIWYLSFENGDVNPQNPQEMGIMGMQTRILRVPKWHFGTFQQENDIKSSLFSASARVVDALQLGTIFQIMPRVARSRWTTPGPLESIQIDSWRKLHPKRPKTQ